jgi:uncharacterized membrane protein YccF (DUF307 family)
VAGISSEPHDVSEAEIDQAGVVSATTDGSEPGQSKARAWAGYAWFMSFGTLLPLPIFLCGYAAHVTQVGAPLARQLYAFGIFLSTMGQKPPGADKIGAKTDGEGKKPFAERVREHSPPGWLLRRGRPVTLPVRVVWFVLVGWWLGLFWVVLAWSVLLLPYPFPDLIRDLLADLPSVMTLAWPEQPPQPAA